jgi:hypothetical protein
MQKSKDESLKRSVVAIYGALLFAVPSEGMDVEALAAMVDDLPARTTLHELDARIGQRLRRRQHLDFCEAFPFEDSVLARFYELHESRTVEKVSYSSASLVWPEASSPYSVLYGLYLCILCSTLVMHRNRHCLMLVLFIPETLSSADWTL